MISEVYTVSPRSLYENQPVFTPFLLHLPYQHPADHSGAYYAQFRSFFRLEGEFRALNVIVARTRKWLWIDNTLERHDNSIERYAM